jgi:glucans biosynthesis protein
MKPEAPRAMRALPYLAAAVALLAAASGMDRAYAFNLEDVVARARALAASPYKKPDTALPKSLQGLNYDQYRDIRYKPDRDYWRAEHLPFELAFFIEGFNFTLPVAINEIVGRRVRPIAFDPSAFDYGANRIDPNGLQGAAYAGFRVHYALNTPKYKDEVLVFLGASYFRAVGKGQVYGASARGLAIDTALQSGEEFPRFVEFWIQRPARKAHELVIYALLDSRRATGAYRFVLKPGTETVMDVKARVFLRENVAKLGLAPLTTMFFSGENDRAPVEDYRPEVHDSDGLSVHSGTGEWLWRPLVNPKRLLVTSYALSNPVGFGLMQRDRAFDDYQDLESRYELRPGVWVEPVGNWGEGRVELVQLPTPDDTNDNVSAYWVPARAPALHEPYGYEYRLHWQMQDAERPPLAWVAQTRRGDRYAQGNKPDPKVTGYTIDFVGPVLGKLAADAPVEAATWHDANGEIIQTNVFHNPVTRGWRVFLRVRRADEHKPVELRVYLRRGQEALSETWSYILPPS